MTGLDTRLQKHLLGQVAKASDEFGLLEEGDRVMVGMSGGKDSYVMWHLLTEVQRKAPFRFELIAVHLDQGHPGFPLHLLEGWLVNNGVPHRILREHTYAIVREKTPAGKAYCSMCSRLRRGILYNAAVEMGCTKIALGHHRDDAIETLMLNLLYGGQIKAMPPRLVSDDGRNVVIRPLIFCAEAEIAELARQLEFPVVPCSLCSQQPDLKRAAVKALIDRLDAENGQVRRNMFAALSNVRPSHLLDSTLRGANDVGEDEAIAALEGGGACAST